MIPFVILCVGFLLLTWWYVGAVRAPEKDWRAAAESELFKVGLELAKVCKERDDAVDALHMLAVEVRKLRPLHTARTVKLPDLDARRSDIEAAIKEELDK